MRNRRRVSHSPYFNIAVNCFHAHLALKISRFNSEGVISKFPKIKTQADHDRKLRMNAWKIAGNDRVESTYNGQLAAVFLRKIAKCKKFYFNNDTSLTALSPLVPVYFINTVKISLFQIRDGGGDCGFFVLFVPLKARA